jgi:predicted GNAT superfamily acetyltransferase
MIIRPLTTFEECRQVANLEKTIWAYAAADEVVPTPVLIASIRRGGILLGAFDEGGALKGFVYSMPAIKERALTQWSHMLGVLPDARNRGLALRLKLAQRDFTLNMGIELIEWTFDPLQASNAHLNFTRLGVIAEDYEENAYGESSSPLHAGTPTDRFIVQWRLRAPHVERRLTTSAAPRMRDSSVASAVLVNPARDLGDWLVPCSRMLDDVSERRLLVEIPTAFEEMQRRRPELALEWRFTTRSIFQTYFQHGYRAVDFFASREAGRGQYLLARRPDA